MALPGGMNPAPPGGPATAGRNWAPSAPLTLCRSPGVGTNLGAVGSPISVGEIRAGLCWPRGSDAYGCTRPPGARGFWHSEVVKRR
jgi:hypothetical protein